MASYLRASLFLEDDPTLIFTLENDPHPVKFHDRKLPLVLRLASPSSVVVRNAFKRAGFRLVKEGNIWHSIWGRFLSQLFPALFFFLSSDSPSVRHIDYCLHINVSTTFPVRMNLVAKITLH